MGVRLLLLWLRVFPISRTDFRGSIILYPSHKFEFIDTGVRVQCGDYDPTSTSIPNLFRGSGPFPSSDRSIVTIPGSFLDLRWVPYSGQSLGPACGLVLTVLIESPVLTISEVRYQSRCQIRNRLSLHLTDCLYTSMTVSTSPCHVPTLTVLPGSGERRGDCRFQAEV